LYGDSIGDSSSGTCSELQQKLIDSGITATLEDGGGCGWWLYFSDIDGNRYFAAEDK